jgi:hypothetical protein
MDDCRKNIINLINSKIKYMSFLLPFLGSVGKSILGSLASSAVETIGKVGQDAIKTVG